MERRLYLLSIITKYKFTKEQTKFFAPMKYLEHKLLDVNSELLEWQRMLGGEIVNNTLHCTYGTIKTFDFTTHQMLIMKLNLNEEAHVMRIISKQRLYYPIIFSGNSIFEPSIDKTTVVNSSNSLSTGIYFSSRDGIIRYPSNYNIQLVILRLPLDCFRQILPTKHPFLSLLKNGKEYHFYESISVEMKIVMHNLVTEEYAESRIEKELAYARSWELFILFAHSFFFRRQNHFTPISEQNKLKIQHIKELILEDLSRPKTIDILVQVCGMSATKLRAMFKEVYGMSIYQFFQENRMEKARQLLKEKKLNVSEVAYHLGYTHLGHFSEAFKKRYNCLPKNFK
jgi:AraC-like DNA-binding protein